MPTLHLPAAHTDTDVALATEVAHVVGSHELYVTWTHGEGPGLIPEVETLTPDEIQAAAISPFAEVVVAMVQSISAIWNAIIRPPSTRAELPAPRDDRRAPRSADAEPRP
ncbi:hypothetical protein [Solirubrobacter soli]|uniref:hypothetical protein n=1 Tax=Solirubrobacter soli TaxID=363832 RepID=UPI0003F5BD6F|nr:hypothetical protein [Solirubrobacter soli]